MGAWSVLQSQAVSDAERMPVKARRGGPPPGVGSGGRSVCRHP